MQSERGEAMAAFARSRGWPYALGETIESRALLSRFAGFLRYRAQRLARPEPHLANVIAIGGEGGGMACDYVTYYERRVESDEGAYREIVAVPHPVVMFGHNPGVPEFTYGPKGMGLMVLQAFGLGRNDGNLAPARLARACNLLLGPDGPTVRAMLDPDSVAMLVEVFGQRIESRSGGLLFYPTHNPTHINMALRAIDRARAIRDAMVRSCRGAVGPPDGGSPCPGDGAGGTEHGKGGTEKGGHSAIRALILDGPPKPRLQRTRPAGRLLGARSRPVCGPVR